MKLILNARNTECFLLSACYLNVETGMVSFFPEEVPDSAAYLEVPNMQPYLRSLYLKKLPYAQENLRKYSIDKNEQLPKWIFMGDRELHQRGYRFEDRCHCLFEEVPPFPDDRNADIESGFWKFAKAELPALIRKWCQEMKIAIIEP